MVVGCPARRFQGGPGIQPEAPLNRQGERRFARDRRDLFRGVYKVPPV